MRRVASVRHRRRAGLECTDRLVTRTGRPRQSPDTGAPTGAAGELALVKLSRRRPVVLLDQAPPGLVRQLLGRAITCGHRTSPSPCRRITAGRGFRRASDRRDLHPGPRRRPVPAARRAPAAAANRENPQPAVLERSRPCRPPVSGIKPARRIAAATAWCRFTRRQRMHKNSRDQHRYPKWCRCRPWPRPAPSKFSSST